MHFIRNYKSIITCIVDVFMCLISRPVAFREFIEVRQNLIDFTAVIFLRSLLKHMFLEIFLCISAFFLH